MNFQDDVIFWPERFKDHVMLLFLLIDSQRANDLKVRAYQEIANWNTYLNFPDLNLLNQLIPSILTLKEDVLKRSQMSLINLVLSSNDFTTLVKHMIKELMFFSRKMNNDISSMEELVFWSQEGSEHTELANHLIPLLQINPRLAHELRVQTAQLAKDLNTNDRILTADTLSVVHQMSNEKMIQLDTLIQQGNRDAIKDLLHMMIEHEIKEGLRGQKRIQEITGHY